MSKRLWISKGKLPGVWAAQWTIQRTESFLDYLASTCNARRAAKENGMDEHQVLARKRSDPEFAAAWQAAIEIWYDRLEEMLIERALLGTLPTGPVTAMTRTTAPAPAPCEVCAAPAEPATDAPTEENCGAGGEPALPVIEPAAMDSDLAKWLLEHHRGPKARAHRAVAPLRPSADETDAALRKQLTARRKRIEAGE